MTDHSERNAIPGFPERLRELREDKGLTRDELAVRAGTSSHSIVKMELGLRYPSLELAWRVAQALGCKVDSLLQPPTKDLPPLKRGRPPELPRKRQRRSRS